MKRNLTIVLLVFAITSCGCAYPVTALASAAQPGIEAMLAKIPLSAFEDGWLSFADVSVLIANTPGAVEPESVEAFERISGTPEGSATLRAYMGLSAGPGDFYAHLTRSREMLQSSALDFFGVRQMIEAGIMPRQQMWLAGAFDGEELRSKLRWKGYLQIQDANPDFEVWCKDGDITGGSRTNLLNRDPDFPFGGNLGRSWPVMLGGTLIGSTPDAQSVQALADGAEPSLMSLGVLSDLIGALTTDDADGKNSLAQLYLLTPAAARLDLPALSEALGQANPAEAYESSAAIDQQPLPAYSMLALAHIYSEDTQWVMVGLSFPDEESAAEAEMVIDSRLQKAVSLRTGEPLADRVRVMEGCMEPMFTITGQSNSHILLIPFRFPAQTAADRNSEPASVPGKPFRFFTSLLMTRDLGWLTIGLPQ